MIANASYCRTVVITIPGVAGGNQSTDIEITDQPDLRYARLQGMSYITDAEQQVGFPTNIPVLSAALIPKVAFVFQTNDPDDFPKMDPGTKSPVANKDLKAGGELGRFTTTLDTIQYIPASSLYINQSNLGGTQPSFVRQMIHWKDRYVVWQKSRVKIAPGGIGNTTDVCIVLQVFYTFIGTGGTIIFPRN